MDDFRVASVAVQTAPVDGVRGSLVSNDATTLDVCEEIWTDSKAFEQPNPI